ncbi:hypothetical protein HHL08_17800 [Sphingobium sp. AR-3-1]|uniref:Uncharacterized protein n=1 Tax=Sphingobium psychrophilum TaxID=2728834 RepID=A0A7X9ZTG8_9SPHN|nr:hypothetical protein [Sphingobium psychrophilum]NML11978.1 hypothetical protein [Sphingobium psychrophilum]
MNALFLKDLADKTRRGLRGRVEKGKSGGGNSYGYDVVKRLDDNGDLIRGDRSINDAQASVIQRILRDYVAGKSARRIATEWQAAKERQKSCQIVRSDSSTMQLWERRRQKYLLSGVLQCSCCGGAHTIGPDPVRRIL